MALAIELVETSEALESLHLEWNYLFAAAGQATPFQSPQWLLSWWCSFAGQHHLWTVAVREGHQLIGLFPLYVEQKADGSRELKFIGSGISDYLGPIVRAGDEESVWNALWKAVADDRSSFDCIQFEQLSATAPWADIELLPQHRFEGESCWVAPLPRSAGDWLEHISPNLSSDIQYSWRRLHRLGNVSFSLTIETNLAAAAETFFELHAKRWSVRGESGVVCDPVVQQFHLQAADRLLRAGMLRLWILRCKGRPVASVYGFSHKQRLYIYLTAFDPAYSKFSVGSLAISGAIEQAIAEGCRAVDFLRGDEPYKARFGAKAKPLITLRCPAGEVRESA